MSKEGNILYGKLRFDETFQYRQEHPLIQIYRNVKVDGSIAIKIGDGHKLHFKEWSELGIKLSAEWEHISTHVFGNIFLMNYRPERNVLLFRRIVGINTAQDPSYLFHNEYEIQKYQNREI